MFLALVREELRRRQSDARRDDSLDSLNVTTQQLEKKHVAQNDKELNTRLTIATRSKDTSGGLRRIVGKVQEKTDVVHRAVLFEIRLEKSGGLHVYLEAERRRRMSDEAA